MKQFSLALLAVAALLAMSHAASAQNYDFTFTSGGVTATGILNVESLGGGTYGILGGTITLTGGSINGTGIILADPLGAGNKFTLQGPPNSDGVNYTIDNLFFPSGSTLLTSDGFNFELTSYTGPPGGIYGNIWGNSPNNYAIVSQGPEGIYSTGGGNLEATDVPEGGATLLYLLLAGAGCFGAIFFRSRNGAGSPALA